MNVQIRTLEVEEVVGRGEIRDRTSEIPNEMPASRIRHIDQILHSLLLRQRRRLDRNHHHFLPQQLHRFRREDLVVVEHPHGRERENEAGIRGGGKGGGEADDGGGILLERFVVRLAIAAPSSGSPDGEEREKDEIGLDVGGGASDGKGEWVVHESSGESVVESVLFRSSDQIRSLSCKLESASSHIAMKSNQTLLEPCS